MSMSLKARGVSEQAMTEMAGLSNMARAPPEAAWPILMRGSHRLETVGLDPDMLVAVFEDGGQAVDVGGLHRRVVGEQKGQKAYFVPERTPAWTSRPDWPA